MRDGDKWARFDPFHGFKLDFTIDFPHPVFGTENRHVVVDFAEHSYVKEVARDDSYALVTFEQSHRATFCVWELGPVWHERHAWVRFLSSKRDQEAKLAYVNDRFAGLV